MNTGKGMSTTVYMFVFIIIIERFEVDFKNNVISRSSSPWSSEAQTGVRQTPSAWWIVNGLQMKVALLMASSKILFSPYIETFK